MDPPETLRNQDFRGFFYVKRAVGNLAQHIWHGFDTIKAGTGSFGGKPVEGREKADMKPDRTLEFYDRNAEQFIENTVYADMHETQERFRELIQPGGRILDFGCGSGRDTAYFLKNGYQVDATDGSEEVVRRAAERTGIAVKQMFFQDLDARDRYDGIWACASILHLRKEELKTVMRKMAAALRCKGVIYASFKYGTFEGWRNGRYFTDFTEESFRLFLSVIQELKAADCWITVDVRPGRENEKWLNLLLRKRP